MGLSPILRIVELKTGYDEEKNPDKKRRNDYRFESNYSTIKK